MKTFIAKIYFFKDIFNFTKKSKLMDLKIFIDLFNLNVYCITCTFCSFNS